MISPRFLLAFVVAGLLLPIVAVVLLAIAGLLTALGDTSCGGFVQTAGLVAGMIWGVDLVCLVLGLGVNAAVEENGGKGSRS